MRRRKGFTIVELLVVMALIIFIMYILSEAFSAGATAFRNLKAIGDMNEKLRTSNSMLRRYLQSDHFDSKRRLSDLDFWKDGPPDQGFFRISQGVGQRGTYEGIDLDGNDSWRATDHCLHFTVKLRGNGRGDYFRSSVPTTPTSSPLLSLPLGDSRYQDTTGVFNSSWAEVVVFMRPSGEKTDDPELPASMQLPVYTLYLRQRLLIPDNTLVQGQVPYTAYSTNGDYAEASCQKDQTNPGFLYFNNPADVTMPVRRMGALLNDTNRTVPYPQIDDPNYLAGYTPTANPAAFPTLEDDPVAGSGKYKSNDVLLNNVVSFEVRVLLDPNQYAAAKAASGNADNYDFVSLWHPVVQKFWSGNPAFSEMVFDTWSSRRDNLYDYSDWATGATNPRNQIPMYQFNGLKIRILALQITTRVWDVNTKQTRQSSIVVEM